MFLRSHILSVWYLWFLVCGWLDLGTFHIEILNKIEHIIKNGITQIGI